MPAAMKWTSFAAWWAPSSERSFGVSRVCALGCGLVTDNEEIFSDGYQRLVKCLALKNEVTRRSAGDVHARHSNVHSSTHATSNSCSELSGSFPKVSDRALVHIVLLTIARRAYPEKSCNHSSIVTSRSINRGKSGNPPL